MNKFLSRIAKGLLGLSLAAGVGVAVASHHNAADVKAANVESVYVLDGTVAQTDDDNKSASTYSKSLTVTQNGISWEVYGNTTMNPWRIGGKSLSGVDRPVYSSTAISDDISLIEITHGTNSGVTVNSLTLIVSTAANGGGTVISTETLTYTASAKASVERPENVSWAGRYFKFVYNCTVTVNSNKYLQMSKIEFFKNSEKQDSSVTITNENPLLLTAGDNATKLNTTSSPSGLALSYASSNEDVVTVDSSGYVTPVARGSARVTASFAGNDQYKASSAQIDVTVLKEVTNLPLNGAISITHPDLDKIGGGNSYVDYNGYHYSAVTDSEAELIWYSLNAMVITESEVNYIQMQNGTSELHNYTPINNLKSVLLDVAQGTYTLKYGASIDNITSDTLTSDCKYFSIKATATLKINSIAITFGEDAPVQKYTVTYDANGGVGTMTDSAEYEAGTTVTVLENAFTKEGYTFDGWKDQDGNTVSGSFTIVKNTTLIAQWSEIVIPEEGEWVLTDLADLAEDDLVVITGNNGSDYAMSNNKAASNPPEAVSVTISDGKITSEVGDNIKWTFSGTSSEFSFTMYDDTAKLYCTATNNGVRVGSNSNNVFSIKDSYLFNNGTSRYLGIYNSQDWRCYTSINSNIKDQTFSFFKFVAETPAPSITEIVQGFVDSCMHLVDIPVSEESRKSDSNACSVAGGYYEVAKAGLTALGSEAIAEFQDNDLFNDAQERYESWAEIYGDATPYSPDITPIAGSAHGINASVNSTASTIIIVVVAIISITSIGVLLVIKRRRIHQ